MSKKSAKDVSPRLTLRDYKAIRSIATPVVDTSPPSGPGTGIPPDAFFSVHKNGTNQTGIVTTTFTKVTWSTELYDEGSFFASNKWTPPAGVVQLSFKIDVSAGLVTSNPIYVQAYKNGAAFKTWITEEAGTMENGVAGTLLDRANGTDYYELYVYHSGTGNKTVSGDAKDTWWTGMRIGL